MRNAERNYLYALLEKALETDHYSSTGVYYDNSPLSQSYTYTSYFPKKPKSKYNNAINKVIEMIKERHTQKPKIEPEVVTWNIDFKIH